MLFRSRVVVFVEEGWVFLCLVEVGGDRWLGWSWIMGLVGDGDGWVWLERAGFFWVWSGWRLVVGVVIFVGEGWVFLGLIKVEIGGHFCTV